MPTFFTDSGSFRDIQVSGSTLLSGSAIVTGSLVVNGGSGTELQVASTGVTIGNIIGDIHRITGSLNTSGSVNVNSSAVTLTAAQVSPNINPQSFFLITGSIQQIQTASVQTYAVNIVPTMVYTTGSQTQTALRVAPTFSGSSVISSSQQNIIADFGATSVGTQFSVNDVTSGSIYMVNDVSGLPIIEALSDWTVNIYNYPTRVFQKTGNSIIISGSLNISGSTNLNGNLIISGNTTIGDATTDSITMNAATMSLGSGTGILNIDSNTFVVDGANNRVGLGKNNPSTTLDVNGNTIVTGSLSVTGVSTFTGNLNAIANVAASTQGQFGGSNASTNRVYRTTNTGADVTPQLWIGSGDLTSGRSSISIEGFSVATLGSINFHTVNASNRYITRAAILSSGSLNTAASESGDLIFLTKPGAPANTAITERLRITSTGTTIVSGTFAFSATSSAGPTGSRGQYNGEIVTFGAGTLTAGQLYFLSSSSTWSLANADSTGSSTGMLGIAVGTTPSDGLLIRGFAYSGSYTTATGSIVYAATSSGLMTTSSPSSSNHVVRVVGYVTNIPNTIYFDPDKTWVTLA